MKPSLFVALLALFPQTPAPSFRSASSELVVLPVVVKDGQGRFVSGLDRERFIVYDNGARQDVQLFTNEDTPVSIALVVDNSGSMRGKMGSVVAAALNFARSSHPDDELFVIGFNDTVQDALDGRSINAEDGETLHQTLSKLSPIGQTALYDAVMDGLEHLSRATKARKVLVLISDGGDNASRATLNQVLDAAHHGNVTIYAIGMYDEFEPDTNPGVLKRLAAATGGERFLPRSPGALIQTCDRIAQEIRSGYILGFEPQRHDGAYHRIRVQLDRPERRMDVRTRPGYFASATAR